MSEPALADELDVPATIDRVEKILLVDDSAVDLELSRIMLAKGGFSGEAVYASSIMEALSALERDRFDCVLLDYHLGADLAIEFIGDLRGAANDVHLPVIVASGLGDESKVIEAVRRGASDYIAKDRLTPVAIHNAVRHCLERARLARELDAKQATLERTNTELRARNQEVESFYHSVSHELKTPLTALREFCALVSDEVLGPVTEAQREALDVSIACCDQLNRMVNDLFDTARIETGKLSLNTRSINLEELVEQELRVLQPKADVAHVTLDADFDRPLPRVNCDPHRIAQVLFNLVGNGIKHSGPGSTIRVQLCTSDDRRSLRIRVSDQGCGIPSDQLEQVFDRLFQVEAAAISAHAGMGVGLYLCRQIVELHGGTITVDSTEGVGSCFSFTLPVA